MKKVGHGRRGGAAPAGEVRPRIEVLGPADSSRRRFMQGMGLAAGTLAVGGFPSLAGVAGGSFEPAPAPFCLGVASGDPDATSVVLWTRLAPEPLEPGGGMEPVPVDVRWEIATDPAMTQVIRRGAVRALPERGHAVHAFAQGLPSDRWLWFRFHAMGVASPIGRTRTFPAPGVRNTRMRLVLASCQHYEQGFYAAWRDAVEQDADFVVMVGDYIYEYATNTDPRLPRQHAGPETKTVDQYRQRYAQYRLDPFLRAMHESCPFIVTWDDHEVENNYASFIPEVDPNDPQTIQEFIRRRENAYRVYAESMPIRPSRLVSTNETTLYRRLSFGSLAELYVLDTRQYRTDQPCGDGLQFLCADALAPSATLTGGTQEQWLFDGLRSSTATWNVLAQQVMMMKWDLGSLLGLKGFFNMDAWDGYPVQRQRIMDFLATAKPNNPVVLTGDIHSSWAADLKQNFDDPASATVGVEFVGTSISSFFGDENVPLVRATLPANPHIKFFDGLKRGYVLCTVDENFWRTDFRAVENAFSPDSPVSTLASFAVEAGVPSLVRL